MLTAVIDWSLRHRGAVILLTLAMAAAGVLALYRLPLDAFPDTTPVQIQVNTVAPALSPLELERQVTARVEQAISGLPGLVEVRSLSRFGLSQVTVVFEDGRDIWQSRQQVLERLQGLRFAPGIEAPKLGPVATGLGEVFHYLVQGEGKSAAELRTLQDWLIAPQLRSVSGVAEVNSWGGEERQIHVLANPSKMLKFDISLGELADALESGNGSVGGGVIEGSGEATLVQGIGLLTSLADIERLVVATREGKPVLVTDVATVKDDHEIRRGAVTADGAPGEVVLGLGFLLVGENSHDVTTRLRTRLEEVRKTLPAGFDVTPVYERTTLVDHVLETVQKNLLEGALLVVAILFIFLGSIRAGLIVAAAIPLSMLFAFDLMLRAGVAGSLMSLGAIDFGLVVDSSVVLVENTVRRLAEDGGRRPRLEVVRDAALEVRRPTLFGELIILIVYLPILFLEGMEGKLFRPMALTVVFTLLGSMVLSMTLMPVLASLGLPKVIRHGDNLLVRTLRRIYAPILNIALRFRWWVLTTAIVILGGTTILATRLGTEFVPRLGEGTIVINTIRLASVSLDESVRYGRFVEKALLAAFPDEIERIWSRSGSAEVATDPMGVELSDVFVSLTPREQWTRAASQDQLVGAMEETLSSFPGMKFAFSQPIEMRINEMVAGIRSDVGVKIFGDDLDGLKAVARQVEAVLKRIPGAEGVTTEQSTGQPTLRIEVDTQAIGRHGITTRNVLAVVAALGTPEVGELVDGERRFPIALRIDERWRTDAKAIGAIPVMSASGDRIRLDRLARIVDLEGPTTVQREWGRRRVVVQTNVRGRDVGSFVDEAAAAIARDVPLPEGWYVRFGGQFEHYEQARNRLLIVVPVALLLIVTLLYVTYGRARDALRVFTGVPFAAVGGVVALWWRDLPFSVSAGVGFVALAGVAVLGDMVLVSAIRRLVDEGRPLLEAIRSAAEERLRPVLMTSLVAALGFVPMALSVGVGAEVQRPLATVVIGGVLSSTALTLLVLPVLYSLTVPKSVRRPPLEVTT
ncbi:MAG: efflux RND transporter permease subunit [Myxococcales bacterium]|nr:efflux RND transporter permease subunit [Myxococcales bacterium]